MSAEERTARASLAARARWHSDQPGAGERHAEEARALRARTAARYIEDVVAQTPPLTPEQRLTLARLLTTPAEVAATDRRDAAQRSLRECGLEFRTGCGRDWTTEALEELAAVAARLAPAP
jgi:hypothetical protein